MKAITSTLTLSLIRCHWLFHRIFNPGIPGLIPGSRDCKIPIPKSEDWEVVIDIDNVCCYQAYFWTYDSESGQCVQRTETTLAGGNGGSMLWSIWSWVSELTVFLVVPLIILTFNVLVIRELRTLDRRSPSSAGDRLHPRSASDATYPPPGKHQVRFLE